MQGLRLPRRMPSLWRDEHDQPTPLPDLPQTAQRRILALLFQPLP